VRVDLKIKSILVIHPIWVIDEYAIIVRRWDWFIPIIPPTRAFVAAITIINVGVDLFRIKARITNGASFCHVASTKHAVQDIDVITDGNQKWNGTIPSFSIIAEVRIRFICGRDEDHCEILLISITLEPNAWAIKYLIVASVSWLLLDMVIIGINLNMLTSIAIHKNSQLVLDIAIIDLVISVEVTKNM
jgi:hypothetical protein